MAMERYYIMLTLRTGETVTADGIRLNSGTTSALWRGTYSGTTNSAEAIGVNDLTTDAGTACRWFSVESCRETASRLRESGYMAETVSGRQIRER